LGQSLDPQKQRLTCMSRLFDFRKHSGEASKTPSAPPKTRSCSRFSVFKVLNFVPTRPACPDSPHFTVPSYMRWALFFCPLLRSRQPALQSCMAICLSRGPRALYLTKLDRAIFHNAVLVLLCIFFLASYGQFAY